MNTLGNSRLWQVIAALAVTTLLLGAGAAQARAEAPVKAPQAVAQAAAPGSAAPTADVRDQLRRLTEGIFLPNRGQYAPETLYHGGGPAPRCGSRPTGCATTWWNRWPSSWRTGRSRCPAGPAG